MLLHFNINSDPGSLPLYDSGGPIADCSLKSTLNSNA